MCTALDGHHRAEDDGLFPALLAQRPELVEVLAGLDLPLDVPEGLGPL
ncbi:hypothetical protein ACFFOS_02370 [Nocardioides kongjuensis]|uniref:Hemerythrin domain-containing protein n=1 Tax=Nocardioides kongjuensis TaxID=349522 RepID=A0A852RPP6_9ACTN|nr:hypothetical protein [Nocardioides kongjuensis]NYD28622.1 hypothetical protein [Nocardioides kongjuensis]